MYVFLLAANAGMNVSNFHDAKLMPHKPRFVPAVTASISALYRTPSSNFTSPVNCDS
jgi:hypothetical protein